MRPRSAGGPVGRTENDKPGLEVRARAARAGVVVRLQDVKGVGPSAARKLERAGVRTPQELARLDLRTTAVSGLTAGHLSALREAARRHLSALLAPDLTLVEGLGPSARRKLERAGISTIEQLAAVDLRRHGIEGLSTPHLQRLKRNARYLLPPSK